MYDKEDILDFCEFGFDNDFHVGQNEALDHFIALEEMYE